MVRRNNEIIIANFKILIVAEYSEFETWNCEKLSWLRQRSHSTTLFPLVIERQRNLKTLPRESEFRTEKFWIVDVEFLSKNFQLSPWTLPSSFRNKSLSLLNFFNFLGCFKCWNLFHEKFRAFDNFKLQTFKLQIYLQGWNFPQSTNWRWRKLSYREKYLEVKINFISTFSRFQLHQLSSFFAGKNRQLGIGKVSKSFPPRNFSCRQNFQLPTYPSSNVFVAERLKRYKLFSDCAK